jgi:hypothetical protein
MTILLALLFHYVSLIPRCLPSLCNVVSCMEYVCQPVLGVGKHVRQTFIVTPCSELESEVIIGAKSIQETCLAPAYFFIQRDLLLETYVY